MAEREGWLGFAAWAAGGTLLTLVLVAAASFGLFLLPVAVALLVLVARRVRLWPESLGVLDGLALTALLIGLLNLDYTPCPDGETLMLAPAQREASCGGLAPAPFLGAGVVLGVLPIALFVLSRRRG